MYVLNETKIGKTEKNGENVNQFFIGIEIPYKQKRKDNSHEI